MPNSSQVRRTIEAHTIHSVFLSEDRLVKMYLPPDYDPSQRYPIIYCHDGNEFFTHGRIATIASQMIAAGRLRPLIIAGIAVSHTHRRDDYALGGNRNEQYIRFVIEECVPYIESQYAVQADKGRLMAGISLGAVVSLALHLRHPRMFPNMLLFSGAFHGQTLEWLRQADDFTSLNAHMVIGTSETEAETPYGVFDFYHGNQVARDHFVQHGAKISYREAPGKHLWGFWQQELPGSLAWIETTIPTNG